MALSDPTNVLVGELRKKELLRRLAAQLSARGGRAQGTGSRFNSAVNLRVGGPRGVGLPAGAAQMLRNLGLALPQGYDPTRPWNAPDTPVIPSGPPAGAGGGTMVDSTASTPGTNDVGMPNNTTYADIGADPAAGWTGSPDPAPTTISAGGPGVLFGGTPSPSISYPDPYQVLADAQMRRIAGTTFRTA